LKDILNFIFGYNIILISEHEPSYVVPSGPVVYDSPPTSGHGYESHYDSHHVEHHGNNRFFFV